MVNKVNPGIQVYSHNGTSGYCVTCKDELETEDIAFLVRLKKDDPYDCLCSACAHELIKAARVGMEKEDVLFYFL